MRIGTLILVVLAYLITWTDARAQDGGDIMYRTIDQLDSSFIGDFVHLDFNRKSKFRKRMDTVSIDIDGQPIKFMERRIDDGYNNWFKHQYLTAIDKIDGLTIRIVKSRLDSITTDSIYVTNYLEYYNDNGKPITEKAKQAVNGFPKAVIAEVLVNAKYHRKRYRDQNR